LGKQFLLDTHVLLWSLSEPERLSESAQQVILNPENLLWVSAASAWEISTKHRLGKLPQAEILLQNYASALQRLQVNSLPITAAHALLAGQHPVPHRDPFDRMLAAQAMLENLVLITKDPGFQDFQLVTIW